MSEINPFEVGEKSSSFLTIRDIKITKETYRILGFWLTYLVSKYWN
jgi:hypothetical protein